MIFINSVCLVSYFFLGLVFVLRPFCFSWFLILFHSSMILEMSPHPKQNKLLNSVFHLCYSFFLFILSNQFCFDKLFLFHLVFHSILIKMINNFCFWHFFFSLSFGHYYSSFHFFFYSISFIDSTYIHFFRKWMSVFMSICFISFFLTETSTSSGYCVYVEQ